MTVEDRSSSTDEPRAPRRGVLIASGVLVVLLAASVFWLFSGEGSAPEPPADVESYETVDGTLVDVEEDRLVMEPFEEVGGSDRLEFTIREQDADQFDLAHLRSHSSIGLPTRLFYEEVDGTLYAVYKEDAPVNTGAD